MLQIWRLCKYTIHHHFMQIHTVLFSLIHTCFTFHLNSFGTYICLTRCNTDLIEKINKMA